MKLVRDRCYLIYSTSIVSTIKGINLESQYFHYTIKLFLLVYTNKTLYLLVPDYLRTKYEPEVEEYEQKLVTVASNLNQDSAQVN